MKKVKSPLMTRKMMLKSCKKMHKAGYQLHGEGNLFHSCARLMGLSPTTVATIYYASADRPKKKGK